MKKITFIATLFLVIGFVPFLVFSAGNKYELTTIKPVQIETSSIPSVKFDNPEYKIQDNDRLRNLNITEFRMCG